MCPKRKVYLIKRIKHKYLVTMNIFFGIGSEVKFFIHKISIVLHIVMHIR